MIIIGAGLAGLLAARRFANYNPVVHEKQDDLPNNHSALLRFRTPAVGEAINVRFKEVIVHKGVLLEDEATITNFPTVKEYNAYSYKSTGGIYAGRSITNIKPVKRYIAPSNFVRTCSIGANVRYKSNIESLHKGDETIISTIPMPALMEILQYPKMPKFVTSKIWTINCDLDNVDTYQTVYIPYNHFEPYRVSITGRRMTIEFTKQPDIPSYYIEKYCDILAISSSYRNVEMREQIYGKIVPINEYERQQFILWATDKFDIYSLGRYATWRQILLDDVIKDIDVISRFITQRVGYDRQLNLKY